MREHSRHGHSRHVPPQLTDDTEPRSFGKVGNGLELRSREPDLPWLVALQGRRRGDYLLRHLEAWDRAGIDLTEEPLVGLGSICSKGNIISTALLISELARMGLKLHTFGYKTDGLLASANEIASADSLSWSRGARWEKTALHGHTHRGHCGNCLDYALQWRAALLDRVHRQHPGHVEDLDSIEDIVTEVAGVR